MWSQNKTRTSRKEDLFKQKSTFWTWIFDYSSSQVLTILLLSLLPLFLLSAFINNALLPEYGNLYTQSAAQEFATLRHAPRQFDFEKIQKKYQLSWFYLVDQDNNVQPSLAFVPKATRAIEKSSLIQEDDDTFFASVHTIKAGQIHAGLPLFSMPNFRAGDFNIFNNLQPGTLVIFSLLVCLEIFGLLRLIFNMPLARMTRRLNHLVPLANTNFTAKELEANKEGGWAPADLRIVEIGIENLMTNALQIREGSAASKNIEKRKWSSVGGKLLSGEYDLSEKSGEQKQLSKNVYQLSAAQTSFEFADLAVTSVKELYPREIKWVVFYSLTDGNLNFECAKDMETYTQEAIGKINHIQITELNDISKIKRSIALGSMQLAKLGLDDFSDRLSFSQMVYFPVFRDEVYGLILVFSEKGSNLGPDQIKVIENFQDNFNGIYIKYRQIERTEDKEWTDPVAGCGNKTFLKQLFAKLDERAIASNTMFFILYITAELQNAELAKFPVDFHNHWLKEIKSVIASVCPTSNRITTQRGRECFLAYLSNNEFCLVLEGENWDPDATAKKIRDTVSNYKNWYGNASQINVSTGTARHKRDGNNTKEVFDRAKIANRFGQENYVSNFHCDAKDIPTDWTPKEISEMEGKLGVLSNVNLLQSIGQAERSGELNVVDALGRQFHIVFQFGVPTEIKMQNLEGKSALTEFITTFKEGSYKFQQRPEGEGGRPTSLPNLDKYLLDCLLWEDKMIWAQKLLNNNDLLLRAVENNDGWMSAYQDQDIAPEEMEAMKTIYQLCDGSVRISGISAKTKVMTTALIWRSVGLLHQYQLIQTRI